MVNRLGIGAGVLIGLVSGASAFFAWQSTGEVAHAATAFVVSGAVLVGTAFLAWKARAALTFRSLTGSNVKARRRLVASIVYVARCCETARPADVSRAYFSVTKELLEDGEIDKAIRYMRSRRAAPIDKILSGSLDASEKRRILIAASQIWSVHGTESEKATRAVEQITDAMGLEGNEINVMLDSPWATEASRLLKSVESVARRTVRRATTRAQRIRTRLRGAG